MINCTNCKKPITMSAWGKYEDSDEWRQVWVHARGFTSCYPRNHMSDSEANPDTDTLQGFLAVYASTPPDGTPRVLLDLDMDKHEGISPFIIVRHQGRVMILNPMALKATDKDEAYLDIDVHAFDADGTPARTGVMAMEDGVRTSLEYLSDGPSAGYPFGLSQRWPGARLVALLLGKQEPA